MLALFEKFLVARDQFSDAEIVRLAAPAAFRKRGLTGHFDRSLRHATAAAEAKTARNAEHFEQILALESERYEALAFGKRTEKLNLQAISDLIDLHFMAKKLRHACFSMAHQAVFRADYDLGLLPQILEHVEKNEAWREPSIGLYFRCFRFLTLPDGDADFRLFLEMLRENDDRFPDDELKSLTRLAINFCIKKINAADSSFFDETMELYETALERGFLLENGLISRFSYTNIVALALKMGRIEWAEKFINDFRARLETAQQEPLFSLNMARVFYRKKDFGAALRMLQKTDNSDLIHALTAKNLQMKIYFELGESDLLDAHLANMTAFLTRQKALSYHRENYLSIIRFVRALAVLPKNDRAEREKLKAQIEASAVTEKAWLLEAIDF